MGWLLSYHEAVLSEMLLKVVAQWDVGTSHNILPDDNCFPTWRPCSSQWLLSTRRRRILHSRRKHEQSSVNTDELGSWQVHGTRFRVHSFLMMRASGFWRTRLVGPVSPGDQYMPQGNQESTAIEIEEDLEDVAAFLWVVYNPCVSYFLQQISFVE